MPVVVVHQPRRRVEVLAGEAEGVGGGAGGGALAEGAVGVGVGDGAGSVAELDDVAVAVGNEVADGRPEHGAEDDAVEAGLPEVGGRERRRRAVHRELGDLAVAVIDEALLGVQNPCVSGFRVGLQTPPSPHVVVVVFLAVSRVLDGNQPIVGIPRVLPCCR